MEPGNRHPVLAFLGRDCGWVLLLVWSCLWSPLTLLLDAMIAQTAIKQLQALAFATVEGKVVDSRIDEIRGETTTYQASVRFNYVVAGREWTGECYRHSLAVLQLRPAEKIVRAYPAGSKTTVYYNPANPAESLLNPGLAAADFFALLCSTPFNIIMFGSWILTARMLRRRRGTGSADLQVFDDGIQVRARPRRLEAIGVAALLALPVSLLTIFVIAYTGGRDPQTPAIAAAWGAVIVAAHFGYRAAHPARHEIVIDRVGGRLTLPARSRDGLPISILLSNILDIRLREEPATNSESKHERAYSCVVLWTDDDGQTAEAPWLTQSDRHKAEQLASWLRAQCLVQ